MFGIVIAYIVFVLIGLVALVPKQAVPPAGISVISGMSENTGYTLAENMEASSIAGHIIYYQNQALDICDASACAPGAITGVVDPAGDTGDYGSSYISIYEANGYVATVFIPQGDQSQILGNATAQLIAQTRHSQWAGFYNASIGGFDNLSIGDIPLTNYTFGSADAIAFTDYAPILVQPVEKFN